MHCIASAFSVCGSPVPSLRKILPCNCLHCCPLSVFPPEAPGAFTICAMPQYCTECPQCPADVPAPRCFLLQVAAIGAMCLSIAFLTVPLLRGSPKGSDLHAAPIVGARPPAARLAAPLPQRKAAVTTSTFPVARSGASSGGVQTARAVRADLVDTSFLGTLRLLPAFLSGLTAALIFVRCQKAPLAPPGRALRSARHPTMALMTAGGESTGLRIGAPLREVLAAELGSTPTADVAVVLDAIAESCKEIAGLLQRASLVGLLGEEGGRNVQGEKQKKMDVEANRLLSAALERTGLVNAVASEEEAGAVRLPRGRYAVAFDPLDGSSNVDCSVPTGTIFSIYDASAPDFSFLGPMDKILVAGYALYSSAVSLVLTWGAGTHIFTLDPETRQFVLTRAHCRCPPRGPYYSLNEGRSPDWPAGLRRYIDDVKRGAGQWGRRYGLRYVCSLVADIHRTLLYGGWAGNPRPHLRLLFESAPISYLLEQAQGAGSDGRARILDTDLRTLHQRSPLFAGSAEDVAELESYGDVQQGAARYE